MNQGTPVALPTKRLSYSQLSTWKQCPAKWRYRYVTRLPDPPGPAAIVGTFVHRAFELLYQEPAAERTQDRARVLAKAAWSETARDQQFLEMQLPAEEQLKMRWEGWALIERLWRFEDPSKVEVLATERRIETVIGGVPFVAIVDRTDQVGEKVVITDYKSGKTPRERDFTQLLLYAEAIGLADGRRPSRCWFLYLKDKSRSCHVNAIVQRRLVRALAATHAEMLTAMQLDRFPAKSGPLCGWCPYVDRCEVGRAFVLDRFESGRIKKTAPALKALGIAYR